MREACGVVGIVAPGRDVAHLCYDALYALQHRGQESAGMATFFNHQITVVKDNGLVSHVFADTTLRALAGSIVIGHTRYSTAEGAFSMVLLEAGVVHAVRDPNGFRPLCLGRLGTEDAPEGWIVASESPALDVVGAAFVREIRPGEMVTITESGVSSTQLLAPASDKELLCIFEFVYFARPDTYLMGHQVHTTRRRMGELLAAQSHVDADIVMGVPDSGVPAAEGFAKASGIPFGYGLVKNRYIGRTFISPDQSLRAATVRRKLNPLRE